MASSLNEESVQKKLQSVTNAQDSIQSLSLWIIHHKTHHKEIVKLWLRVFKKAKAAHRLTLFYLCNDVVQNCKRKNAIVYRESFKDVIKAAAIFGRDPSIKSKVERIFGIWKERGVFDKPYITNLYSIMGTTAPPSTRPSKRHSSKKAAIPANVSHTPPITPKPITPQPDPKIADFKPSVLLDKMKMFAMMEEEVDLRYRQMEHIKLDASSVEAIRQLKDKTHGKEFSQQFEDSCLKLEDYLERQEAANQTRKLVVEQMETAQFFYDEQYREAKIVANAYKNFGTRITNMSKRLNDLRKTLPIMISPVPSPALDAPSPGQTPREDENTEAVDMDLSDEEDVSPAMIHAHTTTTKSILDPISSVTEIRVQVDQQNANNDIQIMNNSSNSQPTISMYQPPSKKGMGDGLDKRLANLIPSLPMSHNSKKNLPEQQDVFSHSAFPDGSSQVFNAKSMLAGGSEGGSTPLSDERCSTPVQDEVPEVEPVDSLFEQMQEASNPIDILTKLISKSQKGAPNAAESNFLQSLSLLTSTVKSQVEKAKIAKTDKMDESTGDEIDDTVEEDSEGSPRQPKSWAAWKAKSAPEEEVSNTPPRPIPSIQLSRSEDQLNESEAGQSAEEEMPDQLQPQSDVSQAGPVQPPVHLQGMASLPAQAMLSAQPQSIVHPGHIPRPTMPAHLQGHQQPLTGHLQAPPGHQQGPPGHQQIPPGHPQAPPRHPGHLPGPMAVPPPVGPPQVPPQSPRQAHPQGPPPVMQGQHPPPMGIPPPMRGPPPVMHQPQMAPRMGAPPLAPPPIPHQVNPAVSYMPPRLNVPPPNFTSPPSGFNPLMTPSRSYMPQASPSQKENWPSSDSNQNTSPSALVPLVGPDMPPHNQRTPPAVDIPTPPFSSPNANKTPKSILRNSQGPVLKEVSQAPGHIADHTSPVTSGPKPPSVPPSPSDSRPPAAFLRHEQPVLQPGEDLIEFTEKLKRKTAESLPEGRPKQPVFSRNSNRPNLTTITPLEEMQDDSGRAGDEMDSDSKEAEPVEEPQSIQSISTVGSVVRRVESTERENSHEEAIQHRRKSVDHSHPGPGHPSRYESDYRDPHYDRHRMERERERERHNYPPQPPHHDPYRDHYARPPPYYHDPYGPSPHKRPYDPYDRRRPYYRY